MILGILANTYHATERAMSDEDAQRAAVIALIEQRTTANTATRELARKTLIAEKLYTKNGDLRKEYGGNGGSTKKT